MAFSNGDALLKTSRCITDLHGAFDLYPRGHQPFKFKVVGHDVILFRFLFWARLARLARVLGLVTLRALIGPLGILVQTSNNLIRVAFYIDRKCPMPILGCPYK